MILSKQKCCLLSTGVSTESQKRTSVLQLRQCFFSNKKYDSCKCWSCTELCEAFTFLMENIYVQFDGMVYQQMVGIPMGTNCAPLIADLFLYCYERDFMSDLQKSKRFDLIYMFNDTSRYLGDIFTIDNPEFEKHIPDIYPAELQLNKANTSDKEFSFLDLNIKVIGSDIHTSVYDKRNDFGFPIVNFGDISFQEYLSKGISHPVFYGDLVYKLRRVKDTPNFISSGSKIVKRLRRRQYDPVIIERTIGLVLGPCTALYRPFLKHCTPTNKAVGTI